jgi:hypothetical protein
MSRLLASPRPDGTTSYLGQLARVPLLTREGEIDPVEAAGRQPEIVPGREGGAVTDGSKEDSVRITQQFRSRDAMVYDLRAGTGRLTLRVTRQGDGPRTEWRTEASTSSSPDAVVVAERGATRAEALRAVWSFVE